MLQVASGHVDKRVPSISVLRCQALTHSDRRADNGLAISSSTDVRVTARGKLQLSSLLMATMEQVSPGARVRHAPHAGIEIVTVMLAGSCTQNQAHIGADDVTAFEATDTWTAVDPVEPMRVVRLWLRHDRTASPRFVQRTVSRRTRLGQLHALAGPGTPLPLASNVIVYSGILGVGETLAMRTQRRCYVMSTLGSITIDDGSCAVRARANDRAIVRAPKSRITALESTELIVVEL